MRGFGLPGCGRGVIVPTSTKPKPSAASASMCAPFLSSPAASPTGFGKSNGFGGFADQRVQAAAVGGLQRRQPEAVRTLGIEGEQERAAERVQGVSGWRSARKAARPPKNRKIATTTSTAIAIDRYPSTRPGDRQAVAFQAIRRAADFACAPCAR
jgi:hypothetical protein